MNYKHLVKINPLDFVIKEVISLSYNPNCIIFEGCKLRK